MNTGCNALFGRRLLGTEAGGVRLLDAPGLSSDVWRCERLTAVLNKYGDAIKITAGPFCLQVRGADGRFIYNIPGTELQSSVGELLARRSADLRP